MRVGGQEHFYLEGQVALAVPGEDDEVTVYSSTQHPTEIQHMVAKVLGIASHAVTVEMPPHGRRLRRQGDPGQLVRLRARWSPRRPAAPPSAGRIATTTWWSPASATTSWSTTRSASTSEGLIQGLDMNFAARCGWSSDLSGPVTDRALFHADNCYWLPAVELRSLPLKTNTCSNTAFRGFGGPQGMVVGERVLEEIAYALGLDPLEVRKRNFYGIDQNNVAPYHQVIEDNVIHALVAELEAQRRLSPPAATRSAPSMPAARCSSAASR